MPAHPKRSVGGGHVGHMGHMPARPKRSVGGGHMGHIFLRSGFKIIRIL
jgi:hypothetical protein